MNIFKEINQAWQSRTVPIVNACAVKSSSAMYHNFVLCPLYEVLTLTPIPEWCRGLLTNHTATDRLQSRILHLHGAGLQ